MKMLDENVMITASSDGAHSLSYFSHSLIDPGRATMKSCVVCLRLAHVPICVAFMVIAALSARVSAESSKVTAASPDVDEVLSPAAIHIGGWLGARIDANESKRLL